MRLLLKAAANRGEERGGSYLKRIVTGTDKDGSPQYRYFRKVAELKAWEKKHKNKTIDQKKQFERSKLDPKTKKEKKKYSKKKPEGDDVTLLVDKEKHEKKVKKSLDLFLKV